MFSNNMEHRRSSNLFCFSVTLAGACPKSIIIVYITFPPWHLMIFVGRKVKYTENSQTCTDGLFQGLKLLVTYLIQYSMGVQKSTESLSFDLRCRMGRPTHSKVYPAVSRIETSQNTLFQSI